MSFLSLKDEVSKKKWPGHIIKPSWDDLSEGGLPRHDELIVEIVNDLSKHAVAIVAPPDHGKTFTAYMVGRYIHDHNNSNVLFANCNNISRLKVLEKLTLLKNDCDGITDASFSALLILDDAHVFGSEEIAEIVAACHIPNITLLMTIRKQHLLERKLSAYGTNIKVAEIEPDATFQAEIAQVFINRVAGPQPKLPDLEQFLKSWANNLHVMTVALFAWRNKGFPLPLADIGEGDVIAFFRDEYRLEPYFSDRIRLLSIITITTQYYLPLWLGFLDSFVIHELESELNDLSKKALLTIDYSHEEPVLQLTDWKSAKWLERAIEECCSENKISTLEVVTKYSDFNPEAGYHLTSGLIKGKYSQFFVEKLLIDDEFAENLKDQFRPPSKSITRLIISYNKLLFATDVESRSRLINRILPTSVIEPLKEQIRGKNASFVLEGLNILKKHNSTFGVWDSWTVDDWNQCINISTVAKLCRLAGYIPKNQLAGEIFVKTFANQNLANYLPAKPFNLKALGKLIWRMKEISPENLPPILTKISTIELDCIADAPPETVSGFLFNYLQASDLDTIETFIKTNSVHVTSSVEKSHEFEAFWLIWHLCVVDIQFASQVALSAKLADKWKALVADDRYVPGAGLLLLCGFQVDDIEAPDKMYFQKAINTQGSTLPILAFYAANEIPDLTDELIAEGTINFRVVASCRRDIESVQSIPVRNFLVEIFQSLSVRKLPLVPA